MREMLPNNFKTNSGQAILVVLLMITVVLTIGLSSVSRSITDIKTTQQSEESTRAFWVAQGNLENAVKANIEIAPSITTDGTINSFVVSSDAGSGATHFVFDDAPNSFGKIGRDEYKVFWLIYHNANGSINSSKKYNGLYVDICFPSKAIETVLIYKEGSSIKYRHSTFDYDPSGHQSNFNGVSSGCGRIYTESGILPYLIIVKSHFMGDGEKMILEFKNDGNDAHTFVSQGSCFNSEATFTVSNIKRKLQECRTFPLPPLIFNNVLFSGEGGILK